MSDDGHPSIRVIGRMRGITVLSLRRCTCISPSMFPDYMMNASKMWFESLHVNLSIVRHDIRFPRNAFYLSLPLRPISFPACLAPILTLGAVYYQLLRFHSTCFPRQG